MRPALTRSASRSCGGSEKSLAGVARKSCRGPRDAPIRSRRTHVRRPSRGTAGTGGGRDAPPPSPHPGTRARVRPGAAEDPRTPGVPTHPRSQRHPRAPSGTTCRAGRRDQHIQPAPSRGRRAVERQPHSRGTVGTPTPAESPPRQPAPAARVAAASRRSVQPPPRQPARRRPRRQAAPPPERTAPSAPTRTAPHRRQPRTPRRAPARNPPRAAARQPHPPPRPPRAHPAPRRPRQPRTAPSASPAPRQTAPPTWRVGAGVFVGRRVAPRVPPLGATAARPWRAPPSLSVAYRTRLLPTVAVLAAYVVVNGRTAAGVARAVRVPHQLMPSSKENLLRQLLRA